MNVKQNQPKTFKDENEIAKTWSGKFGLPRTYLSRKRSKRGLRYQLLTLFFSLSHQNFLNFFNSQTATIQAARIYDRLESPESKIIVGFFGCSLRCLGEPFSCSRCRCVISRADLRLVYSGERRTGQTAMSSFPRDFTTESEYITIRKTLWRFFSSNFGKQSSLLGTEAGTFVFVVTSTLALFLLRLAFFRSKRNRWIIMIGFVLCFCWWIESHERFLR